MKRKLPYVLLALFSGSASAHIGYGGRDFGSFQGGDIGETKTPISITNLSSDFGWAAATDAGYGDSHRLRAFRFNLANPSTVILSVQGGTGFLPGVSLYSGLAHLSPLLASHDSAVASLTYIQSLGEGPKQGSFFALNDWAIGNDPVYNLPNDPASGVVIAASLRYFDYIGHIADGSRANYGNAAGIQGDGVADGFVTAQFTLTAGDYSFFLGGANLATEGPAPFTNFAATVSLSTIPEPSAALLAAAGAAALLRRRPMDCGGKR